MHNLIKYRFKYQRQEHMERKKERADLKKDTEQVEPTEAEIDEQID